MSRTILEPRVSRISEQRTRINCEILNVFAQIGSFPYRYETKKL